MLLIPAPKVIEIDLDVELEKTLEVMESFFLDKESESGFKL